MVVLVVEDRVMVKEGQEGEAIAKMPLIMLEIGVMTFQLQMNGIMRNIQDLSLTQKYLQLRQHQMRNLPPQDSRNKRGKINTHRRHHLANNSKPISNLKLLDPIEARITKIILSMGQHKLKWHLVSRNHLQFSSSKVLLCLNKPYLHLQWL
jgi:hypothetical protein